MSETLSISLFSAMASWMLCLTLMWNSNRNDIKTIRLAVKLFVEGMGKAAVEVLHSPDDHLGLDKFLDKYKAGHFDMSDEDWLEFKEACERVQNDKTLSDAERLAAGAIFGAMCVMLSTHKIERIPTELKERIKAARK